MMEEGKLTGTLLQWSGAFGWIKLDGSAESLFVGRNRLRASGIDVRELTVNTRLRFDRSESARRPGKSEASNISIVSGTESPRPWWERIVEEPLGELPT